MIVVGLTPRHLGPLTPRLSALARDGAVATLDTVTPAVTCSVQATFMTGTLPQDHGIVGNGWLFRDQMEVLLWRQSNRLVGGEKIWEAGKKRDVSLLAPTCSGGTIWPRAMTWVSRRGRSTRPTAVSSRLLHGALRIARRLTRTRAFSAVSVLGAGNHDLRIALDCGSHQTVMSVAPSPTLTLVYLPHLDYDLQRFGPHETSAVNSR